MRTEEEEREGRFGCCSHSRLSKPLFLFPSLRRPRPHVRTTERASSQLAASNLAGVGSEAAEGGWERTCKQASECVYLSLPPSPLPRMNEGGMGGADTTF